MIGIIISCVLNTTSLTTDNVSTYIECLDTKVKVEYVVHWHETISTYFKSDEDILRALGIVFCESRGKPTVIGINTNGTKDIGLWQFNDRTWEWLVGKLNIKGDRFNPELSTEVASWLIRNDGWHHWNSSKHCWVSTDNEYLKIKRNNNE